MRPILHILDKVAPCTHLGAHIQKPRNNGEEKLDNRDSSLKLP